MRASRLVTKERLLEVIAEAITEVEEGGIISTQDFAEEVADEVWGLLGELDDEEDLGVFPTKDDEGDL